VFDFYLFCLVQKFEWVQFKHVVLNSNSLNRKTKILFLQLKFSPSQFGPTSYYRPTWPKSTQLLTPAQLVREPLVLPQNPASPLRKRTHGKLPPPLTSPVTIQPILAHAAHQAHPTYLPPLAVTGRRHPPPPLHRLTSLTPMCPWPPPSPWSKSRSASSPFPPKSGSIVPFTPEMKPKDLNFHYRRTFTLSTTSSLLHRLSATIKGTRALVVLHHTPPRPYSLTFVHEVRRHQAPKGRRNLPSSSVIHTTPPLPFAINEDHLNALSLFSQSRRVEEPDS
jgi:hypothetical protein